MLLPGVSASLVRTTYLNYREHPIYPWISLGAAVVLYLIGYRMWAAPIRYFLMILPASLAVTLLYLRLVSTSVPYSPEDFCTIWYRGEAYAWLVIPWIFAVSFFTMAVPLLMKLSWMPIIFIFGFLWSAVRLSLALATFYYFGAIWMPFFYFALGFLVDFMYVVAFYSLALDGATTWIAQRREVWEG